MLSALEIAGLVGGAVLGLGGLVSLRWGRTRPPSSGEPDEGLQEGVLATLLGHVSLSSRYVIGVCLLLLGYHLISYSIPGRVLWLRIPADRLWMMGVGIAVVVSGSLLLDMRERQ
jgi:hypothetical protein